MIAWYGLLWSVGVAIAHLLGSGTGNEVVRTIFNIMVFSGVVQLFAILDGNRSNRSVD